MSVTASLPTGARRREEILALLEFGAKSRHEFGFGYLGDAGEILTERGIELWITCRMTHSFALGAMLPTGYLAAASADRYRELASHGISALQTYFSDPEYGGFFAALDAGTGRPTAAGGDRKQAYSHAFVVLAAASGATANLPGAQELLTAALATSSHRWWDESAGMVFESYCRDFTVCEPYRGVNAAMHTVESYLAAASVVGDEEYLRRALRIINRVVGQLAPDYDWRFPEHLDTKYQPMPEFNRDRPADPFRPYGATPGHWFEWGRLALQAIAEAEARGILVPGQIADGAYRLIGTGATEAFGVDGAPGYVYTTDFGGKPVVRERMHWVACEAYAAGVAAAMADPARAEIWSEVAAQAWEYIVTYLLEKPGRWIHELDCQNHPAAGTWEGKPDIYHALQAMLFPDLPLAPAFAPAIRQLPRN